jgi:hypothetical protein
VGALDSDIAMSLWTFVFSLKVSDVTASIISGSYD